MSDDVDAAPTFRYGYVFPAAVDVRDVHLYQFYRLVPAGIIQLTTPLGLTGYTHESVEAALTNVPACVERLLQDRVDRIVLGGVPVSARLGRRRVRELLSGIEDQSGVPCDAPLEAVLDAMRHLGLTRLAIGSRWAQDMNDEMCRYLREGGVEVVTVTDRGQQLQQALAMTFDEGLAAALDVGREAGRVGEGAEAILLPGGATMTLHAIAPLEAEFGKPVLTNLNAEIWAGLVRTGVAQPVEGWGTLLASRGSH